MMTVTEIHASGEARVAVRISPNVRWVSPFVGGYRSVFSKYTTSTPASCPRPTSRYPAVAYIR